MKKRLLLILACIALISFPVFAGTDSSGIWITKHYVDEFGLPSDDVYITTEKKIVGTFSNTATTDDFLYASLLLDENVCFQLWEYGDRLVKGYQSKGHEYSIVVLAPDQTKTEMKGIMRDNRDRVILYKEYIPAFYDILNQNGPVSILLKHNKSKYLFTIDDTTGLKEVYLNSFEKMPHYSPGTAEEIPVEFKATLMYSKDLLDDYMYRYVFEIDVTTNLPDGIPLVASVGGDLGLDKAVTGSGTVKDGSCKLVVVAKTRFGLAKTVTVYYKYGTDVSEELVELYGDSFEKLTGEISDQMKESHYWMKYSLS